MSDSLWPRGLQHVRLPCPSLFPGVCSSSYPLSWWCHPTISVLCHPFLLLPSIFLPPFAFSLLIHIHECSTMYCTLNILCVYIYVCVYCCCCSVAKSRLTLCDPVDCRTGGFIVLHYLPEFAQTHVHRVRDAIQPSHTHRHTHAHTSIHTGIVCRLYSIFACPYYFISDSPGEEMALTWRLGGSSAECGPQACPESHGCTAAPGAGHCGFHLLPHRPGSLPSFVLVSHDCSFSVMISRGDWQALWQLPPALGVSGFFLNPSCLCHPAGSYPLGNGAEYQRSLHGKSGCPLTCFLVKKQENASVFSNLLWKCFNLGKIFPGSGPICE